MKNLSLIFAITVLFSLNNFAQTVKKTTTTTTKKTTTVAKKPTTTVKTATKPATTKTTTTTTTAAKPTITTNTTSTTVNNDAETPIVKEPSGPPVTGPIDNGPKSYSSTTTNTTKTTSNNNKPTSNKTKAAPTPKTDYKRKSNDSPRNYFGLRGGYNLATISDPNNVLASTGSFGYQNGYMGGLFFNIGISKSFSIQPELLYSQQGFKVEVNDLFLKDKLEVAKIPILFKLNIGGGNVKFLINAGPYVGYKIKQTSITNLSGTLITESAPFDTDNSDGETTNRIEYGAIGGAGFQFNLGAALLSIEGRFDYGLSDPSKYTDTKPAELNNSGYHRVITGTIGLAFPIGK